MGTNSVKKGPVHMWLASSKAFYRFLVTHTTDGVCTIDENRIIQFANSGLLCMLGYRQRRELIGRCILEFVDKSDHAKVNKRLKERTTRSSEYYQLTLKKADGTSFRASVSSWPLFKGRAYIGTIATIKVASYYTSLVERAEESETRFDRLADQVPAAILEVASDSTARYLNSTARRMFEISNDSPAKAYPLRMFVPEYERHRLDRLRESAIAEKTEQTKRIFPMDILLPGGKIRPALWSAASIHHPSFELRVRIVIIDISELLSSIIIPDSEVFARQNITPKEEAVAKLLIAGLLYKEIAHRLGISLSTVRTHAQSLYKKMRIHTKEELMTALHDGESDYSAENSVMKLFGRFFIPPPAHE